jgi:hypothetical protein
MDYQSLLFAALASPFGLAVETTSPEQLRQRLYAARKGDPSFASLSFIFSPESPESEVWIIKREKN